MPIPDDQTPRGDREDRPGAVPPVPADPQEARRRQRHLDQACFDLRQAEEWILLYRPRGHARGTACSYLAEGPPRLGAMLGAGLVHLIDSTVEGLLSEEGLIDPDPDPDPEP